MNWLVAWKFTKRFWPIIVGAIFVAWFAGVLIERNTLRYEETARKTQARAVRVVLKRAVDWRVTVAEMKVIDAENRRIAEACCTDRDEWQMRFDIERRRPPRVETQIVDRVDGATAETMAVTGAEIASELAESLRDRLGGGGP